MLKFTRPSNNIKFAYLLSFINDLFLPVAIWIFFYSQYLDFKQIAVITGLSAFSTIILEVPTGAFADIFGKKISIICSFIAFATSMLGIAFSTSFAGFLIFMIIQSLANALYSGSLEALVYDTLKETKEEKKFENITSQMETLVWIGLFVGSIAGGFLYKLDPKLPYIMQGFLAILAVIFSFFLREPKIDSRKYHMTGVFKQNLKGFHELFQSFNIGINSLIFIIIAAGYYLAARILGISQAQEYGINPEMVGILFGVGYILSATAAYSFPKIRKIFGSNILFFISTLALVSSFIFAKYVGVVFGSLLIILRISSSTTFINIRAIRFNSLFSSRNRATALSTFNLGSCEE